VSLRRLGKGVGAYAISQATGTVAVLILLPLLSHRWGLTLFGVWAMISTIPAMLVVGDFGIQSSAWSRMTMFVSRGELARARAVLHTAWLAMAVIAATIATLAAVTLWWLSDGVVPVAAGFGETESRATIMAFVLYGISALLFGLITVVIRASGHFPRAMLSSTAAAAAENLALIAGVLLGAGPLEGALILLAARTVSLFVLWVSSVRRYAGLRPGFGAASRGEWAELWPPALHALSLGAGYLVFLQASVVVLGTVAGAAAVPVFVAVRTLSRIGVQAAQLVSWPTAQEFGQEMARGNLFRAGRYFGLVAATSIVMALGMGVGLAGLGRPVVALWTAGLIEPPMAFILVMAVSASATALWNPLSNLLLSVNAQKAIGYVSMAMAAGGLAFIAATGGALGATSAGMAFACVDTAMLAACGVFLARHWLRDPEFRRGAAASLADLRSPLTTLRAHRAGRS